MKTKVIYSGASGSGELYNSGLYPWENELTVLKPEEELPFIPMVGQTVNASDLLSKSTMNTIVKPNNAISDIKAIVYSVDYSHVEKDFLVEILIL